MIDTPITAVSYSGCTKTTKEVCMDDEIERLDTSVRIADPGKFEGERVVVRLAWDAFLEGYAHDDGEVITAEVPIAFRGPDRIPVEWETVMVTEDDHGFVREVTT